MKQTDSISETKTDLIHLIALFADVTGREASTVSRLATGSGDTIYRLKANKRITTDRVATIKQWFSDNWPDAELDWPKHIGRPKRSIPGRAA